MVYFLGRDVSVAVTTESTAADEDIGVKSKKAAAGSTVPAASVFPAVPQHLLARYSLIQ